MMKIYAMLLNTNRHMKGYDPKFLLPMLEGLKRILVNLEKNAPSSTLFSGLEFTR